MVHTNHSAIVTTDYCRSAALLLLTQIMAPHD
jgi:hypothetical protein